MLEYLNVCDSQDAIHTHDKLLQPSRLQLPQLPNSRCMADHPHVSQKRAEDTTIAQKQKSRRAEEQKIRRAEKQKSRKAEEQKSRRAEKQKSRREQKTPQ